MSKQRYWRQAVSEHGVALVAVLWVVALLTIIATSFAINMRTESKLSRNQIDAVRAHYLAEAGVQRALVGLMHSVPAQRWPADGSVQELAIGAASIRVAVFDESGKIDLNAAPANLLDGLLKTAGVGDDQRLALVAAILDWRDTDELRRMNGAEDNDYRATGLVIGAKDAPFESIEELHLVFGMQPQLARILEPAVTVHSRSARVNTRFASRQVLQALLGSDSKQVDAILAARTRNKQSGGEASVAFGVARGAGVPAGQIVSVASEAKMPSGVRAGLKVVARLDVRSESPYAILEWREGGVKLY